MKAWTRTDDGSDVHKTRFRTSVTKVFTMNNGKPMEAEIGGREGAMAAGVIALTDDNRVVIARQFRCGPELVMDELPGGLVDEGEEPEVAARRELLEEVGYEADSMELVGKSYADAWNNMVHYYYLARGCRRVAEPMPEEFEEVEVATITIEQFIQNAHESKMTDISAVFFAYDKLNSIKEDS